MGLVGDTVELQEVRAFGASLENGAGTILLTGSYYVEEFVPESGNYVLTPAVITIEECLDIHRFEVDAEVLEIAVGCQPGNILWPDREEAR